METATAKQIDQRAENSALHYIIVKAQFHTKENYGHIVYLDMEERAA